MTQYIEFHVEHGNVLSYDADVVALKYAQDFYSADMAVANALAGANVDINTLRPKAGEYRLVDTNGSINAKYALFIGVPPLSLFDYNEIRIFSGRMLRIISVESPEVKHIATTIHGPSYGLDEVESFLALLGGCIESIKNNTSIPPGLEKITVVEKDKERAARLGRVLSQFREQGNMNDFISIPKRSDNLSQWFVKLPFASLIERAGIENGRKTHVFVAMSFSNKMEDVYHYGIQNSVHSIDCLCERVDKEPFIGDIWDRIKKKIETAALIIAELSEESPNVYLEVGYAWGKNRPTILLIEATKKICFDVSGHRCLRYESIKNLEEILTRELKGLKTEGAI